MRNAIFILAVTLWSACGAQEAAEERLEREALAKNKVRSVTVTQADYAIVGGKRQLGEAYKASKRGYDRKGGLVEEIAYSRRGTIESWIKYECDKHGNAEVFRNYKPDGSLDFATQSDNRYDSLGRLQLQLLYDRDTMQSHKLQYWYDADGNMEQMEIYKVVHHTDEDGVTTASAIFDSYEKHFYDAKGRTVRVEYYDNAHNYKGRVECKYGADGRMSEKVDAYAYVYKYGANGLQVEASSWGGANGDVPVSVYKLTYEYYK